jgi:hypothetical protein
MVLVKVLTAQLVVRLEDRAWNRAWRACAVCAPPTVEPRTPRTPLSGGARRGARSAGPTRAPGAPVVTLGRGGVVRNSSEPRPRCRTAPAFKVAGRLSRYPTRTPSAVSGPTATRTRRPPGRSGPLTGQQPPVSEAIGSVVRPTGADAGRTCSVSAYTYGLILLLGHQPCGPKLLVTALLDKTRSRLRRPQRRRPPTGGSRSSPGSPPRGRAGPTRSPAPGS